MVKKLSTIDYTVEQKAMEGRWSTLDLRTINFCHRHHYFAFFQSHFIIFSTNVAQGLEQRCSTWNKMVVELYQPQELHQCLKRDRAWKFLHHVDLGWKRRDAEGRQPVSEEVDFQKPKLALLWADDEAMGWQPLKDHPEMFKMLGKGPGGDDNIVNIDRHERESLQDTIHEMQERLSSIS